MYERASERVLPRSRDQILNAGALAALDRRAAELDPIPGLGPGQTRAVITCMSADGSETFTETVATERGALIPAGLDRALRQPGACQHGADHLVDVRRPGSDVPAAGSGPDVELFGMVAPGK